MKEIKKVFEKKVRALCDFSLNTLLQDKTFISGEVALMKFLNREQFNSFLDMRKFEEVDENTPVECNIPVIEKPFVVEEIEEFDEEDTEEFVLENNLKNKVDEFVFRDG